MIVKIKLTDFKNHYSIKHEIEKIEIDNEMKDIIVICKISQ